ncbi:hypothetical protein DVH05_000542 [Phytophthora capsici]|nr:hypothetical protein DVH05_010146 [Phytophthora capsici]KAG1712807.1 hypothetical protein DVH05_000542 [Phytophthora capsici]
MSATANFYYLNPGAFEVVGYAYGRAEGPPSRRGKVTVSLVRSGRWATQEEQQVEMSLADIIDREVTEAEALMGAGTFVGGAVCTTWVPTGGARVWVYGLVVGYSWNAEQKEGCLDVNLGDVVESIPYKSDSFQDIPVEIYALRPCAQRGASAIMPGELKRIHQEMYQKFNGIDQAAVRDVNELTTDARTSGVDEATVLPIFDVSSSELSHVTVKQILDHVYYKDGKRTPPPGLVLHESIFTTDEETRTAEGAVQQLDDGLSDSDDDALLPPTSRTNARDAEEPPKKRRRIESETRPRVMEPEDRLRELRNRCSGDQDLQMDIDQLISLRRVGATAERSGLIAMTGSGAAEDKNHFQPSSTQSRIHQALVHGKFAYMTPQQFVEHVQIHWNTYGFFPHPAVLRGLFSWDFGTRGLSVMHFVRVTDREKREAVRRHDMSCFSRKNTLPLPRSATDFATVLGAIDVLSNLANQLYQLVVQELFADLSRLLLELRVQEMSTSERALSELVSWIDDRLELFRVHVADNAMVQAASIKAQFSTSHEAFMRINQLILRQDIEAALEASKAVSIPNRTEEQPIRKAAGASEKRRAKQPVPVEVLKALPKQGGKAVCMRYLSQEGCRGWGGKCRVDGRVHFKPAALDDIVKKYIEKTYGGLSSDMQ